MTLQAMYHGASSRVRFRSTQTVLVAFLTVILLWFGASHLHFRISKPDQVAVQPSVIDPGEQTSPNQILSYGHLAGHESILNPDVDVLKIAKVNITVVQGRHEPPALMQQLEIKLPDPSPVNLDDSLFDPSLPQPASSATTIRIPSFPPSNADVNASHFIFGVATTYPRLLESLDPISHWASHSDAKIIGLMAPTNDPDAEPAVLAKAASLHVSLRTIESSLEFLDRYFTLLKVLHENRTPQTKWYVFIDDDTFFLDLARLVRTFNKYDHTKPYYIGALTEDFRQMAQWGFMAYGGAGIFLSAALVEQLLPSFEKCLGNRNTGDRMLSQCIYRYTSTRFTWEHDLHQVDLHGDQAGFYEALRPQPLSVHHWKSHDFMSVIDVFNMSRVARVCGNECVLQKYKFANGWVLTNGFSLVKYSKQDLKNRDLNTDVSMERTWLFWDGTNVEHYEHALGPVREPDLEKVSFKMESAVVEGDGRVRQLYVRRQQTGEIDSVVEITWVPG